MTTKEFKQLKSGTDIRGVAVSGLADHPLTLTDEAVRAITDGFALWLSKRAERHVGPLRISVGHDSRITSEHISALVIDTLRSAGIAVTDCGLASTPAMFMTTVDLGCDGAVQITASHHPYYRNGLKFLPVPVDWMVAILTAFWNLRRRVRPCIPVCRARLLPIRI